MKNFNFQFPNDLADALIPPDVEWHAKGDGIPQN